MNKFAYLSEVEGKEALEFVNQNNARTLGVLTTDPKFSEIQSKVREIFLDQDKIAWGTKVGEYMYNFWQDTTHVRGIYRRTSLKDYKNAKPNWETVLDIDALAEKEKKNWVWGGADSLHPTHELALIYLSDGGKDAQVVREFNLKKKEFVPDGFYIPEAKSDVTWLNRDFLYVGSDFGDNDSMTTSGYPRTIRKLCRGQSLDQAPIVFEVKEVDLSAGSFVYHKDGYEVFSRNISFYETELFLATDRGIKQIDMPRDANLYGFHKGFVLFYLTSDLTSKAGTFKSGSLVSFPEEMMFSNPKDHLEVVFSPSKMFLSTVSFTKDYLILETLENVMTKLLLVDRKGTSWRVSPIFDQIKNPSISTEFESNDVFLSYSDFMTPSTQAVSSVNDPLKVEVIKTGKHRYKSDDVIFSQNWAKSSDGTLIPYFIVHKKDLQLNGKNPTLLEGYGGFQVSSEVSYLGASGRVWVEEGGVYVLANIRGGGEFGPDWHQSAILKNKHKSYEDFIAIAEDLINRKVTTPRHLGIQGGSNGGLLVGAVFTKRPDLFNAVLCQVPLLDMENYHKFLAGASWMGEYGNPEDPEMLEYIKTYSPVTNLQVEAKYPEVFFMTSTKDDRVTPYHARLMSKMMDEMGHPSLYYENLEGGHGGSANLEQSILWIALEYTYLWRKLK